MQHKITAPGAVAFGGGLSVYKDLLLVGTRSTGEVYLFNRWANGSWEQQAKISGGPIRSVDSLALYGGRVIVLVMH